LQNTNKGAAHLCGLPKEIQGVPKVRRIFFKRLYLSQFFEFNNAVRLL